MCNVRFAGQILQTNKGLEKTSTVEALSRRIHVFDGPDNESDHVQFGLMATTNLSLKWLAFVQSCHKGLDSWMHNVQTDDTKKYCT